MRNPTAGSHSHSLIQVKMHRRRALLKQQSRQRQWSQRPCLRPQAAPFRPPHGIGRFCRTGTPKTGRPGEPTAGRCRDRSATRLQKNGRPIKLCDICTALLSGFIPSRSLKLLIRPRCGERRCPRERERSRRGEKKGPDDGEPCRGRVFHPTGHSGDVQQVHRPMPEEVRPRYEDVVTKPLDIAANIFAS